MNTKDTIKGLSAVRTIMVIGAVFIVGGLIIYIVSVLKPLAKAKDAAEDAYEAAKDGIENTIDAGKNAINDTKEYTEEAWKPVHDVTGVLLPWDITLSGVKGDAERLYEIVDKTSGVVSGRWMYDSISNTAELTKDKLQEYWGKVF